MCGLAASPPPGGYNQGSGHEVWRAECWLVSASSGHPAPPLSLLRPSLTRARAQPPGWTSCLWSLMLLPSILPWRGLQAPCGHIKPCSEACSASSCTWPGSCAKAPTTPGPCALLISSYSAPLPDAFLPPCCPVTSCACPRPSVLDDIVFVTSEHISLAHQSPSTVWGGFVWTSRVLPLGPREQGADSLGHGAMVSWDEA